MCKKGRLKPPLLTRQHVFAKATVKALKPKTELKPENSARKPKTSVLELKPKSSALKLKTSELEPKPSALPPP